MLSEIDMPPTEASRAITTAIVPTVTRPPTTPSKAARMLAFALFVGAALSGRLLFAPVAFAGEWIQVSCANPDGSPALSEGWSSSVAGAPGVGSNNSTSCTPISPMYALLSSTLPAPVGAGEGLAYTPPPGSTLAGGTLNVTLSADGYGVGASGTAVLYTPTPAYDASDVFFQCAAQIVTCNGGTTDFTGIVAIPVDRGGDLYLAAACGGISGQYCNTGGANGVWSLVQLHSADLLLSNASSPTATGFSGSLLTPDAHGTADLAFTATDPNGPGIYNATIQIDSTLIYNTTPNLNLGACVPAATDAATGALMFDTQQPCPQTETIDVPVDTTMLADGTHNLKVTLTDAAQNTSTVLDQPITVLNHPAPAAPTPTPPAVAAPVYTILPDRETRRLERGTDRPYNHSALRLAGTVTSSAGAAIGVQVTLWTQPPDGGNPIELEHTTSDASGRWTLTAPRGPSRQLRVTAGANALATVVSALRARERVRPLISLHVAAPGHGLIIFTGRLQIAPLGHPRPLVLIQTRGPHGWEVVGTITRVNLAGGYRVSYRSAPITRNRRFAFRAVTPKTTNWQAATSRIISDVIH